MLLVDFLDQVAAPLHEVADRLASLLLEFDQIVVAGQFQGAQGRLSGQNNALLIIAGLVGKCALASFHLLRHSKIYVKE